MVTKVYKEGSRGRTKRLDSREALGEYIMGKLGGGVVKVNISLEQLNLVIDEAVDFFIERHNDGVEEILVTVPINSTTRQNGYSTLPENIVGISEVLDTSTRNGADSFDSLNYLIANSEILDMSNNLDGIQTYVQNFTNIRTIKHFFTTFHDYEYNKATNRLWYRGNIENIGTFAILGYRALDEGLDGGLFNDIWLRKYATALARVQWGDNLTKFIGVDMPGQGTLNGEGILQRGLDEVNKLEEEFELTYASPSLPFVG